MRKNPFDHNKFIGYVSRVTPELTRVHFPNSYLLKKFYFDGDVLHSGIVRNYVIIEGEGFGFLGRIVQVELPEKEKLLLNEPALQRKDSDLHPSGEIEIQLAFSIFGEIKAKKGLDQYPPIGSRVYACSPEYLELFLKDFGKDEDDGVGDDLLDLATLPQDEDYSIKISANSLFGRHCAVVGTTGGGKSYTVARIIEEMLTKNTPVKIMLLDSTGEYQRISEHVESENIVFGDGGNAYLHHKDLTESDLFALFRPSGQVQMPILQNAIKSLKLAKILEDKKVKDANFVFPSYYSLGNIRKSGNKDDYESQLLVNATSINSDNADFNIEKLPQQIQYECVWPDADYGNNSLKWGNEDKGAATNSASLITRIKSRLNGRDFALSFGLTSESQNNRETFEKRFREFYNGSKKVLRIDISKVGFEENLREVLVNSIGRSFLSRFQNAPSENFRDKPVVFIVDEAHQLFRVETIKDEYSNEFRLDAFERIAKETRKKGLFLCLATQRPRDIPPGVLSQMGSFIVHRLINPQDRDAIVSAAPDGSKYLLSFLPSLGQGEALLLGVDFPMPVNLRIKKVSNRFRPDSETPKLFRKVKPQN
jgi:DNA helicase HerA-like ATPase